MTEQKVQIKESEIIYMVEKLVKRFQELLISSDDAEKNLGLNIDCSLSQAAWWTFQDYADLVSKTIGDNDGDISYFLCENQCGKEGLIWEIDKEEIVIDSVEKFVKCFIRKTYKD